MKKRTIKEAVLEALKRANKALSVKEIYSLIIEQDLYRFNAEDPENIVKVEIRRHCEGIDFPTAKPNKFFQILKDGKYWIKDVLIPGVDKGSLESELLVRKDSQSLKGIVSELREIHTKHTIAFKQQILNQLKNVDPTTFEIFSRKLLEVYGFVEMVVTQPKKDGGLDGYGKLKIGITYLNVAFQSKRWKNNNVSRVEVDRFRGAIQGDYEQGIIFTTSSFSKDALNATVKKGAVPIILIDGSTLVDIMIQKRLGVDVEGMEVYVNALDRALTEEL